MSIRGIQLLTAQLRVHGGQVLPNQADGHNVYGPHDVRLATVEGSGEIDNQHAREQLRDVLAAAVTAARSSNERYDLTPHRTMLDWVVVHDTTNDRRVATCHISDAPAILAGLIDRDITMED